MFICNAYMHYLYVIFIHLKFTNIFSLVNVKYLLILEFMIKTSKQCQHVMNTIHSYSPSMFSFSDNNFSMELKI